MRRPGRSVWIGLWLGLVAACELGEEASSAPKAVPDGVRYPASAEERALLVYWAFRPSAEERRALVPALLRIAQGREPLVGRLDRFPASSVRWRYLLIEHDSGRDKPAREFFYVLIWDQERGKVSVSRPFQAGPPNAFIADAEAMMDYDGDGAADFAYCLWPETVEVEGNLEIVGYRDGEWYRIPKPAEHAPDCPAVSI